jgi:hypothetical protein
MFVIDVTCLSIDGEDQHDQMVKINTTNNTTLITWKDQEMTPFRNFGYRELEESRVKTLHHKNSEVSKCETLKI